MFGQPRVVELELGAGVEVPSLAPKVRATDVEQIKRGLSVMASLVGAEAAVRRTAPAGFALAPGGSYPETPSPLSPASSSSEISPPGKVKAPPKSGTKAKAKAKAKTSPKKASPKAKPKASPKKAALAKAKTAAASAKAKAKAAAAKAKAKAKSKAKAEAKATAKTKAIAAVKKLPEITKQTQKRPPPKELPVPKADRRKLVGKGGGKQAQGAASKRKEALGNICRADLRRIARKAGCRRLAGTIYAEAREALAGFLEKVVGDAAVYTEYAQRKTVTPADIILGLRRQGRIHYGLTGG
eukprot:TRINITY_DN18153_c1_g2_i1.p1 TRINITY_DN18153_c1_g2~~TRINITY_DN18153_c1_g2_i1.p1  ORF type:complete len:314 (+),score=104.40 TRINITY_DN18153_c1_g2_i1:49-942(+)